jgi:hypothetical protein
LGDGLIVRGNRPSALDTKRDWRIASRVLHALRCEAALSGQGIADASDGGIAADDVADCIGGDITARRRPDAVLREEACAGQDKCLFQSTRADLTAFRVAQSDDIFTRRRE